MAELTRTSEQDTAYDAAIDRAMAKAKRQRPYWQKVTEWREQLISIADGRPIKRIDDVFELFDGLQWDAPQWAYAEALLTLSYEARYTDPIAMEALAFAAATAAEGVENDKQAHKRYSTAQIADLKVRAGGELANAYRRNYRFEQAEEVLLGALDYFQREGTGDPQIHGRLLDLLASLRLDQRQLGAALDLLDKVRQIYEEIGDLHLAGRALISKGISNFYDGNPREAASQLREGLALLNPERDPNLFASGQFNRLAALVEADEYVEASSVLMKSDLRQAFADDPLNLLKLRWLEGKIFAGRGKLRRGEAILREVQEGFLLRQRQYEAAMVSLELTAVLLRQGKTGEAEKAASQALETFQGLKINSEARKAVLYLREACRRKTATAALAQTVLRFLQRLERDPSLRFLPQP
jgi:tetratricopeptide (TPR) repeat protein